MMINKLFYRTFSFAAVFGTIIAFVCISFAKAEVSWTDGSRPKTTFDGKEYYSSHIWVDFLDVAFSDFVWNEDRFLKSGPPDKFARMLEWYSLQDWDLQTENAKKEFEYRKSWAPWFVDYLYRQKGLPEHNVIHKWDGDVSVGLGWPVQNSGVDYFSEISEPEEYYGVIGDEVQKISSILEAQIGYKVDIFAREDKRETTENFAKIRIVPVEKIIPRHWMDIGKNVVGISDLDRYLLGAVLFESADPSLLEGFLIPKGNNSLGMVICKIVVKDIPEHLLRSLVRECMIRGMGLPMQLSSVEGAYLSDWLQKDYLETETLPARPSYLVDHSDSIAEALSSGPKEISSYDKLMLKMLYCRDIKSGFDKNIIVKIFTENSKCKI